MPQLIHLNGPPGIGKSTLARMYVDRHPGTLNLDVDRVRMMVGGWQDRFTETGGIVRPIAKSMAATHLTAGHDVVLPQYLGRLSELEAFESVVLESGAHFVEIVLMDTKGCAIDRFANRGTDDADPWHRQVQEIVEAGGGTDLLASMYDQLDEVVRARPDALVVDSREGATDQTYEALLAALGAPR